MSENQDAVVNGNADLSENEEEQQTPSNPSLSEIDSETMKKLRGDAIGDTLYSESFVVKTLMQLSDSSQWCEKLEEDLCFLWDATMDKDVCNFLLELSYPNIACGLIRTCDEARLVEILIGILANICCICNDSSIISDDEVESVLIMFSSEDPLILIQVVRFLKAVAHNTVSAPFITENILEQFNFILLNSINNELIINSLDALSKVTVYNKIDVTLLKGEFIKSSCVAYQTLCKNLKVQIDLTSFSHIIQIISNICTYINESSNKSISDMLISVNINIDIFLLELKQFFSYYMNGQHLLPLEAELLFIVDALVSVFQILNIKYCSSLFKSMAVITSILIEHEWEDIDVFFEFFCYFIFVSDYDKIRSDLNRLPKASVLPILNRIKNNKAEYQFNYIQNFNSLYVEYIKD